MNETRCLFSWSIFSLLIIFYSCTNEGNVEENLVTLQLSEVLTIESNEENSSSAPILPFVADVAVNSEGHIFIFTGQDSKFHIYDQDGKWIKSFGSSGAGPGEFEQVSTIYIDSRDRLVVADRENGRISILDNQGTLVTTSSSGGINTIQSIREMPDGRFITTGQRNESLIHIFDSEFSSIQSSFSTVEEFMNTERESEKQWIMRQAGQAHPWSEGRIAFVPANYQGVIYLYEEKGINDWHLVEKIDGYHTFEPALSFRPDQPKSGTPVHGLVSSPAGMMFITYHTLSYGFYNTQEGSLYHISYQTTEAGMNLIIESFDSASNRLIEYGIVDDLDIDHYLRKQPLWIDDALNLYLTDNSEIPRLIKFNLKLN